MFFLLAGVVTPIERIFRYIKEGEMKCRLMILSCCVFSLLFSSSLYARSGPYMSASIGMNSPVDAELNDSSEPGVTIEVSFDPGLAAGAAFGYDFDRFRAEAEILYATHDIDESEFKGSDVPEHMRGIGFSSSGDASVTSLMFNGYFDFINTSGFTPFITAGLGLSKIEVNDYNIDIIASEVPSINDDDTVLSYQVGVGAGFEVSEQITIDLKYRYFGAEDVSIDGAEADVARHDILAGVRVNF
ncbi:MAG: outer membrane beta-barrel protein [Thermodesulfobacteriota bacterium]